MLRRTDAVFTQQIGHGSGHNVGRRLQRLTVMKVALLQNFPETVPEWITSFLVFAEKEIHEQHLQIEEPLDSRSGHQLHRCRADGLLPQADDVLHFPAIKVVEVRLNNFPRMPYLAVLQ